MSVPARLGAFGLVLVLTFGGGWALGNTFGPDDTVPAEHGGHIPPVTTTTTALSHGHEMSER